MSSCHKDKRSITERANRLIGPHRRIKSAHERVSSASFMAVQPAHPWAVNKEIIELTQKSRVPTIHETLTGGGVSLSGWLPQQLVSLFNLVTWTVIAVLSCCAEMFLNDIGSQKMDPSTAISIMRSLWQNVHLFQLLISKDFCCFCVFYFICKRFIF